MAKTIKIDEINNLIKENIKRILKENEMPSNDENAVNQIVDKYTSNNSNLTDNLIENLNEYKENLENLPKYFEFVKQAIIETEGPKIVNTVMNRYGTGIIHMFEQPIAYESELGEELDGNVSQIDGFVKNAMRWHRFINFDVNLAFNQDDTMIIGISVDFELTDIEDVVKNILEQYI